MGDLSCLSRILVATREVRLLRQVRSRDPLRNAHNLRSLSRRPLQSLQAKRGKIECVSQLNCNYRTHAGIHREHMVSTCNVRTIIAMDIECCSTGFRFQFDLGTIYGN